MTMSPKDLDEAVANTFDVDQIIERLDKSLLTQALQHSVSEYVVTEHGLIPTMISSSIIQRYKLVGWKSVRVAFSSTPINNTTFLFQR